MQLEMEGGKIHSPLCLLMYSAAAAAAACIEPFSEENIGLQPVGKPRANNIRTRGRCGRVRVLIRTGIQLT